MLRHILYKFLNNDCQIDIEIILHKPLIDFDF